jgi:hypothetical protein
MDSSVSHTHSARRRGWWLAPVLIVLAIAIAWMARAAILRGVAELWVDPLDRADAIVVLPPSAAGLIYGPLLLRTFTGAGLLLGF